MWTEEKKREALRIKEVKDTPPTTPAETALPPLAPVIEFVATPTPDIMTEVSTAAVELATLDEASEVPQDEDANNELFSSRVWARVFEKLRKDPPDYDAADVEKSKVEDLQREKANGLYVQHFGLLPSVIVGQPI